MAVGKPVERGEYDPVMRRVGCAHYSACLRFAADKNWESFCCAPCPDYWPTNEVRAAADNIAASFARGRA